MLKTGYEDFPQYKAILGIDEVGYGCGAGDLYVAGVILPIDYTNEELKDSKKITSEKKRKRISDELIENKNLIYLIESVSVDYINKFGITSALKLAFSSIAKKLSGKYDAIFVDGIDTRGINEDVDLITVVKGDDTYQNIAAASIIAKVHRDEYMIRMNDEFPGYDFASNKGYLTKKHLSGIKENGQNKIHRLQYIKKYI